jgi:hypothetical protein
MKLRTKDRPLFVFDWEGVGEVYVFCVTTSLLGVLSKRFGALEEADPEAVVRFLFTQVAYRCSSEGTPESREQCQQIATSEAESLDRKGLEEFARRFLETADNLGVLGEEEGPFVDQLCRVLARIVREHAKIIKGVVDQFKGLKESLFPKSIIQQMAEGTILSKQLRSSVSSMQELVESFNREPCLKDYQPSTPLLADVTAIENPIDKTNEKLDDLLKIQASSIPILTDSAKLLDGLNELTQSLAVDYKASARKATIVSVLTAILAFATLVATVTFSWLSYRSSSESSLQIERLLGRIDRLNTTMAAPRVESSKASAPDIPQTGKAERSVEPPASSIPTTSAGEAEQASKPQAGPPESLRK